MSELFLGFLKSSLRHLANFITYVVLTHLRSVTARAVISIFFNSNVMGHYYYNSNLQNQQIRHYCSYSTIFNGIRQD
jgi:hypothetical protein